ncbi:MAG: lipid A biosynthesis acyltransferase [Gammaproteobacteria bacterium]|nr:lipid A biosynthesis acyltransferase [Gammaproteobacteria bacterium]
MPRSFARFWLYPITLYFLLTAPRVRFSSRNYLRRIPGKSGNLIQIAKHIYWFSSTILDRVYFLTGQFHHFDIDIHGDELINEINEKKTGCILLGAHVGSFEVLRCLAISRHKIPLKIMMYHDHNAMITQVLDELNPEVTSSIINLSDNDALLQMKESIDEGDIIGMLGDRVIDGEKQVTCRLLGEDVSMPAGPVTLASIFQVPIILFYVVYLGDNRYSIHIEKIADTISAPRKKRNEVVTEYMQKYTSTIEDVLKKHPYNWFNYFDYWNDRK